MGVRSMMNAMKMGNNPASDAERQEIDVLKSQLADLLKPAESLLIWEIAIARAKAGVSLKQAVKDAAGEVLALKVALANSNDDDEYVVSSPLKEFLHVKFAITGKLASDEDGSPAVLHNVGLEPTEASLFEQLRLKSQR